MTLPRTKKGTPARDGEEAGGTWNRGEYDHVKNTFYAYSVVQTVTVVYRTRSQKMHELIMVSQNTERKVRIGNLC